jgi:Arc/MetJ-type ribon-helix-helix transcriptional regulator
MMESFKIPHSAVSADGTPSKKHLEATPLFCTKYLFTYGTIWYRGKMQKQKIAEAEGLQAAVRLPKSDHLKIQHLIDAGLYRSYADFLRDAVRDKLGTMEVISVKNVTAKEAERMIEDYLKEHPGPSFASEIADALGLEFGITFETINKLLKEGKIKKAKK